MALGRARGRPRAEEFPRKEEVNERKNEDESGSKEPEVFVLGGSLEEDPFWVAEKAEQKGGSVALVGRSMVGKLREETGKSDAKGDGSKGKEEVMSTVSRLEEENSISDSESEEQWGN